MAKILENNVVVTISKVVKNDDTSEELSLPAEFTDNLLELISQLLGEQYVVELTGI